MDVTRLLSSLLSLFCTMISGIGGSKTLPMDQPIFSTKSIYHGYSLLCTSASSKAILFSFIFLPWVSLPLCLFEAHCYVEMLRVLHYTRFSFFHFWDRLDKSCTVNRVHFCTPTLRVQLWKAISLYMLQIKNVITESHVKPLCIISFLKWGSLAFFIPLQVTSLKILVQHLLVCFEKELK